MKKISILIVALILLPAFVGCGSGIKATIADFNASLGKLSRILLKYGKDSQNWFIVKDGCVITQDAESLKGRLPEAKPAQVISRGNPRLKRVAITIDDGWNADMRILELLRSEGVRFTAFLIGDRGVAESHPELIKAIKEAGGEVCSHTYSHYVMRGKDKNFVLSEIWKSQEIITRVTHEVYPYIRFSGGAYDEPALRWTSEQGFWVINWTAASDDTASGIAVETEVNNILSRLQPGAILLFHFGGHNTYECLRRLIPEIRSRGYEPTSLSRVLEGTPFYLKNLKSEPEAARQSRSQEDESL